MSMDQSLVFWSLVCFTKLETEGIFYKNHGIMNVLPVKDLGQSIYQRMNACDYNFLGCII